MPTVPNAEMSPAMDQSSQMDRQPSETDLLMAAASMHKQGRLIDPQRSMPSGPNRPNPSKPHRGGKLKVVK